MKIEIVGTLPELRQLYEDEVLSKLLCIDYYKLHLVDNQEVFIIEESDFKRVGLILGAEEEC